MKQNPSWTWDRALEYDRKSHKIFPAIEIRESILDYLESIEGYRRKCG